MFLCGEGGGSNLAHRNRSDFCDCNAHRGPARFPRPEKAMLHCDLRVRWKVASDLRFRAAISEPKAPSFCGISGDLAPSTRKSLAIAIVRFWCAKGSKNLLAQACLQEWATERAISGTIHQAIVMARLTCREHSWLSLNPNLGRGVPRECRKDKIGLKSG